VILVAIFAIARTLPVARALESLHGWIDDLGVLGPVVYGLIYVTATVLLIPGSILTIAAGVFFGLWFGAVIVSASSTAGAAIAFLIARYLARRRVASVAQAHPKFKAIDKAIGDGGWKIVALLRLSPAVPFNAQNYLLGLTPVRFPAYVLTSWIAMLPGTFLYVYIGHVTALAALGEPRRMTTIEWIMLGIGGLATVTVTVYVTRLARNRLKELTVSADRDCSTADRER